MEAALTFKDRALPIIEMGVPVVRLHSRAKEPIDTGWQNRATTDVAQIEAWNKETPEANCGSVAKADGFLFFESDAPGVIRRYEQETGESFETFTVSSRPGRFHFYFRQTPLSKKVGSITQAKLKFGTLRQHNAYVVAPNSIHPETGEPYRVVKNVPIIPAPDRFINWLVEKSGVDEKSPAAPTGQKILQGGRNSSLATYAGKLRHDGLESDELEVVLLRYNRENCVPPLADDEVKTIARSIGRYEKGLVGTGLLLDGHEAGAPVIPTAEEVQQKTALQALVDSTPNTREESADTIADSMYPYWAYNKTLYEEFATFCGQGNLIPKELFIESMKTVVGAICGHRFSPQEGRFYTFILTKIGGVGKGTAFSAVRELFAGTGLLYPLGQDGTGAFVNIGTAQANFGSSAGLQNGVAKHTRIIQIFDELTKVLEKFSIPGSGDAYLDDLNSLYETGGYTPSLTKESKVIGGAQSGDTHHSMLGGTVFDKWNSAFSKTTAEGSGFFQRLNLISTEETETVAEVEKLNFNEGEGLKLRQKFLAKIMPLEFQQIVFEKTPEATKRFDEWYAGFKAEHRDEPADVKGRLNVLVSRNYEHLAWMLAPDIKPAPENSAEPIRITCNLDVMEKAIALSEYQYQVRSKHRPAQGANESALIEDLIRLTLLSSERNSLSRSDLYKKSGSRKYGLVMFDKVLNSMCAEGLVEVGDKTGSKIRGRKGKIIVWAGE
jgi:hypothetical protein